MKPRLLSVLPLLLGAAAFVPSPATAAPQIEVTLEDDLATDNDPADVANEGDVIEYRATITNTGDQTATGVTFDAELDAKIRQIADSENISPLALDDAYEAIGNTPLKVGVAAGTGPEVVVAGSAFANDREFLGDSFSFDATLTPTAANGQVSFNSDGTFTYLPNPGFEGVDTFTYRIADAAGLTGTATVRITVSTPVWYVDGTAAAGGDGRATSPLNSLAGLNDGSVPDEAGDVIYLYAGSTYSGGLTLLNDQRLVGGGSALVVEGRTLVAAGARPTLSHTANTLTLAQNNEVAGLHLTSTGGHALTGSNFGTLEASLGNVTSTGGSALRLLTGDATLTAETVSASSIPAGGNGIQLSAVGGSVTINGSTTITSPNGAGIALANCSAPVSFGDVTVNSRGGDGIHISGATGDSITFGSVTIPNQANAGGHGIRIQNGSAPVVFASTTITATRQTAATSDTNADGHPESEGNGDAIFILNQTGAVTINGGTLSNLACDGIDIRDSASLLVTGMTITDIGLNSGNTLTVDSAGIFVRNLSGTLSVKDSSIRNFHGAVDAGLFSAGHQERGINIRNHNVSFTQIRLDNVDMENDPAHGLEGADGFEAVFSGAVSGSIKIFNDCSFKHLSDGEGVQIVHTGSGTLDVEVLDSDFTQAVQWDHDSNPATAKQGGFGGIDFAADGSATCRVHIDGCHFHDLYMGNFTAGIVNLRARGTSACSFLFTNNTMDGDAMDNQAGRIGVNITAGDAGSTSPGDPAPTRFDVLIEGNTIDDTDDDAFTVEVRGRALSNGTPGNIIIRNNLIGQTAAVSRRSAFEGGRIRLRDAVAKTVNLLITGNSIRNHGNSSGDGVLEITSEASGTVVNATVTNNTFKNDDPSVGAPVFYADVRSGGVMHLDLSGNTAHAVTNVHATEYLINNGGLIHVKGPGTGAVSAADIQAANPSGGGIAFIGSGTTQFNNNANITQPTAPSPPALPLMADPEMPAPAPVSAAATVVPTAGEAPQTPAGRVTYELAQSELDRMAEIARSRWIETGLTPAQRDLLDSVTLSVVNLHGLHLGASRPGFIDLDADAATTGWFIDATPFSDEEFGISGDSRMKAQPGTPAANRMDLLTTVMHEMGHQLGLGDLYDRDARGRLMFGYLIPGERRLPQAGEADGAIPTGRSHDEYLLAPFVIGDLPAGKSVTLTFRAEVDLAVGTEISLQGTVSGDNFDDVLSDNPDTVAAGDATITPYHGNQPPVVAADNATVSGFAGDELANTGTWSDPDDGQTVTLSASTGALVQNGDGTWSWSITPATSTEDPVTVTITANDGTGLANAETQATFTYEAALRPQAIDFELAGTSSHTATVTLSATGGDSGNAVTFSIVSGPGEIDGNSLTFTGTGDVEVAADQAGTAIYAAAPTVTRTITATNAAPVLAVTGDPLTVTVQETETATASGTFSDADGDEVTFAATAGGDSIGTVTPGAGTWQWSLPNASPGTHTVRITGTDALGADAFVEFTLVVEANPYLAWLAANGMTGENLGMNDDYDNDGVVNLLELAFGTDPTVPSPQALDAPIVDGTRTLAERGRPFHETINTSAAPKMTVLLMRRTSHAADGLTYHVEFSWDMNSWQTSSATPQVLLTDGDYELVEVPYPFFLSNGKKARFFRVRVEYTAP